MKEEEASRGKQGDSGVVFSGVHSLIFWSFWRSLRADPYDVTRTSETPTSQRLPPSRTDCTWKSPRSLSEPLPRTLSPERVFIGGERLHVTGKLLPHPLGWRDSAGLLTCFDWPGHFCLLILLDFKSVVCFTAQQTGKCLNSFRVGLNPTES